MNVPFEHRNFSINESAELLRVSRSMVYKLIEAKKLTPRKIGTRTILTGAELARFLDHAVTS
jgi:excisionase family DNA binding protein